MSSSNLGNHISKHQLSKWIFFYHAKYWNGRHSARFWFIVLLCITCCVAWGVSWVPCVGHPDAPQHLIQFVDWDMCLFSKKTSYCCFISHHKKKRTYTHISPYICVAWFCCSAVLDVWCWLVREAKTSPRSVGSRSVCAFFLIGKIYIRALVLPWFPKSQKQHVFWKT